MSEANRNLQMQSIKNQLMDYHIKRDYQKYAESIMRGKRIDFFQNGWDVVVSKMQSQYFGADGSKLPTDVTPHLESSLSNLQQHDNAPFMKVDNKIWTIKDFRKSIQIHPLEIDVKSLTKENFPRRLQAAVAGLVTDTYLTKLAYMKKYDRSYAVNRVVNDWRTYFLFLYQRDRYLKQKGFKGNIAKDYFQAFDDYLTPYIDSLKTKYDGMICFNPHSNDRLQKKRPLHTSGTAISCGDQFSQSQLQAI